MLESTVEDRIEIHTVKNPASGRTVEIPAGDRLDVRFTHVGVTARWEVVARPHNLVPLAIGRTSFSFLVFRSDQPVQELVFRKVGVRGAETRTLHVAAIPE
jgi:hypothetical protein